MVTEPEEHTPPASAAFSAPGWLAFAGLVGAAAFVFVVLPRWAARPVVTTEAPPVTTMAAAAPIPSPPPLPAPSVAATLAEPGPALDAPSVTASSLPTGEFEDAVSEALAALERGDPEAARAAFARAEALRPGTSAVKDGMARADAALRARELEVLRERGQAAEAGEEWPAALAAYDQARKLDPAVRFAVEGTARASLRAEMADRLDAYLRRPDRLGTEAVAHEAELALDRAAEISPAGPRLLRQIEELGRRLAEARTPVPVRLLSDDRTEVAVLRVGPQGRFREKSLELRPGTYVVVGTRRGYRDIRQTLVVRPGRSPEPLVVRCHEAL